MDPLDYPEHALRARNQRQVLDWTLILSAANIPFQVIQNAEGWWVVVSPEDTERARRELAAVRRINRHWPPKDPSLHDVEYRAFSPFGIATMLILFSLWIGFYNGSELLRAAASDAEKIRGGEWWRCLTALGIHADLKHLGSNLIFITAFAFGVCWRVGDGVGSWLILLSGALGNAVVALISDNHLSVGASTASFGALGVLVGIRGMELLRLKDWRGMSRQAILPIGAGLAMLAITGGGGVDGRVDVAAHVFGFLCGVILGAPFGFRQMRVHAEWGQRVLELSCLLFYLFAWRMVFAGLD